MVCLILQPIFLDLVKGQDERITSDDLYSIWTVATKAKTSIAHGYRLENLSWRLWFNSTNKARRIRQEGGADTAADGASTLSDSAAGDKSLPSSPSALATQQHEGQLGVPSAAAKDSSVMARSIATDIPPRSKPITHSTYSAILAEIQQASIKANSTFGPRADLSPAKATMFKAPLALKKKKKNVDVFLKKYNLAPAGETLSTPSLRMGTVSKVPVQSCVAKPPAINSTKPSTSTTAVLPKATAAAATNTAAVKTVKKAAGAVVQPSPIATVVFSDCSADDDDGDDDDNGDDSISEDGVSSEELYSEPTSTTVSTGKDARAAAVHNDLFQKCDLKPRNSSPNDGQHKRVSLLTMLLNQHPEARRSGSCPPAPVGTPPIDPSSSNAGQQSPRRQSNSTRAVATTTGAGRGPLPDYNTPLFIW